ncbi:uncharacterized protein N7484_006265 [Penicillium longicatenatum]|uniref:uncharacterized protein n=1 Tax=Penicillium longicatenatum TaxID=1561947 RepID=UPI002547DCBA|nr:uncharacterized protein N7484_006265 [Penicillium longicatenatum]KAJ5643758.1 hypothetical protein N7484_006265 [Penicillium longicatenatum]
MTRQFGVPVDTHPAKPPPAATFIGRTVRLEKLDPRHTDDLWESIGQHTEVWAYIPDGPFQDKESFIPFIERLSKSPDPYLYALIDAPSNKTVGFFSLMRIDQKNRVVEIGYVVFSPMLQRTTAATEAFYLIAKAVFEDLGYRRFEWKCDSHNEPSKKAAARFGFTAEGVFRQHMMIKGRNRDTAWFSMLDSEWPAVRASFEKWLDAANFVNGKQVSSLAALRGQ